VSSRGGEARKLTAKDADVKLAVVGVNLMLTIADSTSAVMVVRAAPTKVTRHKAKPRREILRNYSMAKQWAWKMLGGSQWIRKAESIRSVDMMK
jgi:hypothetical protein